MKTCSISTKGQNGKKNPQTSAWVRHHDSTTTEQSSVYTGYGKVGVEAGMLLGLNYSTYEQIMYDGCLGQLFLKQ